MEEIEQEESGLEMTALNLTDSVTGSALNTDLLMSDRTDSLLQESTLQEKTLSEQTLEADLLEEEFKSEVLLTTKSFADDFDTLLRRSEPTSPKPDVPDIQTTFVTTQVTEAAITSHTDYGQQRNWHGFHFKGSGWFNRSNQIHHHCHLKCRSFCKGCI